jgi:hypothetical protein
MSYITKFDGRTDKTIKVGGEGNPSFVEGYFLGSKDTESDYGPGKLHLFQTAEGIVGVWGKTRMNTLLTEDHRGQMVLLSFTGMIAPTKKGRRPSYGYQLKYNPKDTIDVANINVNAESASASDDDESESQYVSDDTNDNVEEIVETAPVRPVAPARPATTPSPAKQAALQALLNKNKAKTV